MKNNKVSKAYLDLILKKGTPSSLLKRCLCEGNANEFQKIVELIKKRDEFLYIKESLFRKDYSLFENSKGIGISNNIEKTLLWFVNIILSYSNEVNKYVECRDDFENYILCDELEKAEDVLDYIDSNICVSFWSLKNRLLINNLKGGVSQQKYIESLHLSKYMESIALIFANMTDISDDYYIYNKKINYLIKDLQLNCKMYYKHLFSSNINYEKKELKDFLFLVSLNSIVDIYNSIIDLFRNDAFDIYLSNIVKLLNTNILDHRLNSVAILNGDNEFSINDEIIELLLKFQENCYDEFIENYFLNDNYQIVNSFHVIRLVATSLLIKSRENLIKPQNYSNLLFSILIYVKELILSDDYESFKIASDELLGISKILYGFSISAQIKEFVNYYIAGRIEGNFVKTCYNEVDVYIVKKIIGLEYPMLFPENVLITRKKDVEYSDVESMEEISALHVSSKKRLIYEIARKKQDYDKAIKIFAEFIMDESMTKYSMITSKVEKECEKSILLKKKINEYELVFIFSNKYLESKRNIVFRKFHRQNNMEKPLDIKNSDFDLNFKIYFLKNISSKEMLYALYGRFNDDDEVDYYRIEICKELCNLDEKNKEIYIKEISELSKSIGLRMMQRDIDESKLSVDFDYIKENVYSDFASNLRQYFDTPQDKLELANIYSPISQNDLMVDQTSFGYFVKSRNVIIENMFRIYAEEFCFGMKGIDTFISTRIRHGPFEHEISSVFNEYNIIDFKNDFYTKQLKLGTLNKSAKIAIDDLCDEIDKEVRLCVEQKFKVYIDNKIENAIFDYNMSQTDFDFIIMHKDFNDCRTAYKFIDIFRDCIKEKTNKYLLEIQEGVLERFLNKMYLLLNSFLKNIEKEKCYKEILNNVTHCKTELQNKIDQMKTWFHLSEEALNIDYCWNDLISITRKSFEGQFENFKNVAFSCECNAKSILRGDTFSNFYDVFEILINNAIQHSLFSKMSKLKINIKIDESDGDIIIKVVNNLSKNVDFEKTELAIKKANEKFINSEYENNTNKEGGMGLMKTMNILFSIMNLKGNFSIELVNDCFELKFIINKDGVVIEN